KSCEQGFCGSPTGGGAGGGSGTAGGSASAGGTGTSGGAAASFACSSTRTVALFDAPVVDAGYDQYHWAVPAEPPDAGTTDDLGQPIADGGCVVVQAATIDAGWN